MNLPGESKIYGNKKFKAIELLKNIAMFYLIGGLISLTVFVTGFNESVWMLTASIGFILAWIQLYLLASIVHGYYMRKKTEEVSTAV